jgi:hypothetical protein
VNNLIIFINIVYMLLFLQSSHIGIKQISISVSLTNKKIIKNIPKLSNNNNHINNINSTQIINAKYETKLLNNLSTVFMLLFLVLMNIYLSSYYVIITF